MNQKPITPDMHGVLDYAFAGLNALAPSIFGMHGAARKICYGFAAAQAGLAAVTDNRRGLTRQVSMEVHGVLDVAQLPLVLALPTVTGAIVHRNVRRYFTRFFLAGAATWLLTDYRTPRRLTGGAPRPGRALGTGDAAKTGDVAQDDAMREMEMHAY